MVTKTVLVKNKTGLHARPASDLVQLAKGFQCDITLTGPGVQLNPKSIISILKAGVGPGTSLELVTEGADEKEASEAIARLIESFEE